MIFKDNYFFLSTFYTVHINVEINDKYITFKNVETAYQAFKNPEYAEKFVLLKPLEAKKIGEKIPITYPNWDVEKLYVMARLQHLKFQNVALLFQLRLIKGDITNENFWGDTFWGVCKGEGENILGKMLMIIRDTGNDLNALLTYVNDLVMEKCITAA